MSLQQEYEAMIKEEGFLKTFPLFKGTWEEDKELFEAISEENNQLFDSDIEISDEDEEDYDY